MNSDRRHSHGGQTQDRAPLARAGHAATIRCPSFTWRKNRLSFHNRLYISNIRVKRRGRILCSLFRSSLLIQVIIFLFLHIQGWWNRSRSFAAHPTKEEEVKKVHRSQNQKHHAQLPAQGFKNPGGSQNNRVELQIEGYETNIDEVKTHHQKVVHAIGHVGVTVKAFDKEDPPVSVQSPRHPDRDGNGNEKIEGVGSCSFVHGIILVGD